MDEIIDGMFSLVFCDIMILGYFILFSILCKEVTDIIIFPSKYYAIIAFLVIFHYLNLP